MRVAYFTQTRKVGNSLYVRIPKDVRMICQIEDGDYVRIEVQRIGMTELVLERPDMKREYSVGEEGKEDD